MNYGCDWAKGFPVIALTGLQSSYPPAQAKRTMAVPLN